ncbi:MAG: hypothetical protein OCD00_19870 [Colwellia sp.]
MIKSIAFCFTIFSISQLTACTSQQNNKNTSPEVISDNQQQESESNLSLNADMVQQKIHNMMQYTASWLDSIDSDSDTILDAKSAKNMSKASAKGYFQVGWLPRAGDFSEVDSKFKVKLSLPRWDEKISLVLDNDDDNELKLDYEASKIEKLDEDNNFKVSLQYFKKLGDNINMRHRLGVSRDQLFARSEIKRKWNFDNFDLIITPRVDYFNSDGWAPSLKTAVIYPLEENSVLSFSASWQKVQDEFDSRKKVGIYHINRLGKEQTLITGVQYYNNKDAIESVLLSFRYRDLFHKKWLYYEVEPFVEFDQERDYYRSFGIALRLIGYYGYN